MAPFRVFQTDFPRKFDVVHEKIRDRALKIVSTGGEIVTVMQGLNESFSLREFFSVVDQCTEGNLA